MKSECPTTDKFITRVKNDSRSVTERSNDDASGAAHVAPNNWLNLLYRVNPIRSFVGRVEALETDMFGQIRLALKLSVGKVILVINRNKLPETVGEGSWIQACLMLPRITSQPGRLFNVSMLQEQEVFRKRQGSDSHGFPFCWVPAEASDNPRRMRDLQNILATIQPGLQTFFMLAVTNARVQKQFFNRIAADDHHVYNGGLLDASVKAAKILMMQAELTHRERGLGALACLLFDIGKVSEDTFRSDLRGARASVEPHVRTLGLISKAMQLLESLDSGLAGELRTVLTPFCGNRPLRTAGMSPTLKEWVCEAVWRSRKVGEIMPIETSRSCDKSSRGTDGEEGKLA